MAPRPTAISETDPNALNAGDIEVLDAIFKAMAPTAESKLAPWNVVAETLNLKNGKNAKQRFHRLALKRGWFVGEFSVADSSGTPASAEKSSAKRGSAKKRIQQEVADDEDTVMETPTKKPKLDTDQKVDTKHEEIQNDQGDQGEQPPANSPIDLDEGLVFLDHSTDDFDLKYEEGLQLIDEFYD